MNKLCCGHSPEKCMHSSRWGNFMFQSLHLDNFASKFIWLPSPVDRELHFVRFYHPMQIATFPGHAWLLSCPDKFRAAEMQRPFNASRGLVMLIGCSLLIGFTLPSAKLGSGAHKALPWQIGLKSPRMSVLSEELTLVRYHASRRAEDMAPSQGLRRHPTL